MVHTLELGAVVAQADSIACSATPAPEVKTETKGRHIPAAKKREDWKRVGAAVIQMQTPAKDAGQSFNFSMIISNPMLWVEKQSSRI
jgi:hypothetical protein